MTELRSPNPFFEPEYYRNIYRDLSQMDGKDLFRHWSEHGSSEGSRGCEEFYLKWYVDHHSDLQRAYGDDYLGDFSTGSITVTHFEGRKTAPGHVLQLAWLDGVNAEGA